MSGHCQACQSGKSAEAGQGKPARVVAILDFSSDKSTSGRPPLYFETAPDGRPFISHFLERALQVDYIEEFIAIVHPRLQAQASVFFRAFPIIRVLPVPEDVPRFYNRHEWIDKGRKWSYFSIKGGASDVSWYDETIPMSLIRVIAPQVPARCVLHLHPEAPLFDPHYASQLLDVELKDEGSQAGNFPILIRHAPLGLSPALLTRNGLALLHRGTCWSPAQVFRYFMDLDGLVRLGIHVKNNMDSDQERGCLLLRSRRDLDHMRGVMAALSGIGAQVNADSLQKLRRESPEIFLEKLPREVDVEITSAAYPDCSRLPKPEDRGEMALELFSRIYSELCSWEDGLLTIGDLGDPLRHSRLKEIGEVIRRAKPHGLHMILNAETMLEMGDPVMSWLEGMELDVLTVRLTPLSYSGKYKLLDFDPVVKRLAAWMHRDGRAPMIHLEIHKHEENWRDFKQLYDWQKDHTISSNWASYNDYCGQMPAMRNMPAYFPRERSACERLACQLYVLPDGATPICKQDFSGSFPVGKLEDSELGKIWNNDGLVAKRLAQARGDFGSSPLCAACRQWFHT